MTGRAAVLGIEPEDLPEPKADRMTGVIGPATPGYDRDLEYCNARPC